MNNNGVALACRRTIWERLGFGHAFVPRHELPEEAWWIVVNVTTVLSWRDRLRALISGRVHVQHLHITDVPAQIVGGSTATKVLPPGEVGHG